jgi:hypothetical protein
MPFGKLQIDVGATITENYGGCTGYGRLLVSIQIFLNHAATGVSAARIVGWAKAYSAIPTYSSTRSSHSFTNVLNT